MRSKWMQSPQWTGWLILVGSGTSFDRFKKCRRGPWSLRHLSTTLAMIAGSVSSMCASQAQMFDASSGDSSGRGCGFSATATVAGLSVSCVATVAVIAPVSPPLLINAERVIARPL